MSTVLLPGGYTGGMSGEGAHFGEWLIEQIERHDWSQADFARLSKLNPQNISRWINNDRVPSPASCLRIAAVLNVDDDVVLRAAGHKRPSDTQPRARSFDDILRELEAQRPIAVPIIEQIASAGHGEAAVGYVYLPPLAGKRPGLFAMKVHGSCMVPRINDGDTIVVDREMAPDIGKIVVAVAGENWDRVLVKRLIEREYRYWLKPNQGEPILVDDSVRIVGVVIQIISEA